MNIGDKMQKTKINNLFFKDSSIHSLLSKVENHIFNELPWNKKVMPKERNMPIKMPFQSRSSSQILGVRM